MKYGFEDWYCLLAESYVDKQVNKAARYIERNHARLIGLERTQAGNPKTAKDLANDVKNQMPILVSKDNNPKPGKFIVGASRIFYDEIDNNQRDVSAQLSRYIRTLIQDGHTDQFDEDLNGMSFEQLEQTFKQATQEADEKERDEFSAKKWQRNPDYTIVKINNTEEASKYAPYLNPDMPWCITQDQQFYDNYTRGGLGVFYFVLKNGYENIEPIQGKNWPHDEYGESMMAVAVGEDGQLLNCTSRWNGSGDFFTAKQLSELLGVNFYETFLPRPFEETVEKLHLVKLGPFWTLLHKLGYMAIQKTDGWGGTRYEGVGPWFKVAKPDYENKKIDYAYALSDHRNQFLYSRKTGRIVEEGPDTPFNFYLKYSIPEFDDGNPVPLFVPSRIHHIDNELLARVTKLEVEEGNPYYRKSGGCLYFDGNEESFVAKEKGLIWMPQDAEEVSVEEGTTSFTAQAMNSSKLRSISFPEGLETIGENAFSGCTSLKSVNFPKTLKSIGFLAFKNVHLNTVNLPEGVKIDDSAFFCSVIRNLSFYVDSDIENKAFAGCMLGKVDVLPAKSPIQYSDNKFIEIPTRCFRLSNIDRLTLPEGLQAIGCRAFEECKFDAQPELVLPESLREISDYAFQKTTGLISVRFPKNSNVDLKPYVFAYSTIESVELPKSFNDFKSIGHHCFCGCNYLKSVVIPEKTSELGEFCFSNCDNLEFAYLPEGLSRIGRHAFREDARLKWINVPSTATEIDERAELFWASKVYVHESLKGNPMWQDVMDHRAEVIFYRSPAELPYHPSVEPVAPATQQGQPAMESFSGFLGKKRGLHGF